MDTIIRIALLQLTPTGSLDGNLRKGLEACRKAHELGADIALFPEMWSNGYSIQGNPPENWDSLSFDSCFISSFKVLSRELGMAIGITFLEQSDAGMRNSLALFDRKGKCVLRYSKVHTCDFSDERYLVPGDDFYTAELDVEGDSVVVGAMICYDREFPESARILMLKGAELILVPNACPMEVNRLSQLRARAFENMAAIAVCNYPSTVPDCNGHSNAFDGVAYLPDVAESRDTCILLAGEEEGVYIAELNLDRLRAYRKAEVHGNAYRKPGKYHLLCSEKVKEPFVRSDSRR